MEYFLALNDAKAGPFTLYRVGEMLEDGTADGDTLAWHRGLDGWKPLREIPALEALRKQRILPPNPAPSATPVPIGEPSPPVPPFPPVDPLPGNPLPEVGAPQAGAVVIEAAARTVHPFRRFWARVFDYGIVTVIVSYATGYHPPQPVEGEAFLESWARLMEAAASPEAELYARTLLYAMLGWHAVEAVLIYLIGTTPGKALFGIRVSNDEDGRLSPRISFARSYYVYAAGMGFYLPFLMLIGMVFGLIRLLASGRCLWDHHLGSRVEHAPLGIVRIVLAIFAVFALFTLPALRFS
jgi:hypothetical protein